MRLVVATPVAVVVGESWWWVVVAVVLVLVVLWVTWLLHDASNCTRLPLAFGHACIPACAGTGQLCSLVLRFARVRNSLPPAALGDAQESARFQYKSRSGVQRMFLSRHANCSQSLSNTLISMPNVVSHINYASGLER